MADQQPSGTRTMEGTQGKQGSVPNITNEEQFVKAFQGIISWAEQHYGPDYKNVLRQALTESNPVKYLEEQVRQYQSRDVSRR